MLDKNKQTKTESFKIKNLFVYRFFVYKSKTTTTT